MRLLIDTSKVTFTVTRGFAPKVDQTTGRQKTDRNTGVELYTIQLMALDENGAEVILVTIAGAVREIAQGTQVAVVELEAIPWNTANRSGVAYRAASVTPVGGARQSAATTSSPAAS